MDNMQTKHSNDKWFMRNVFQESGKVHVHQRKWVSFFFFFLKNDNIMGREFFNILRNVLPISNLSSLI